LYTNRTGYANASHGFHALYNNWGGYNNTASGSTALYFNYNGSGNTASGEQSLYFNEDGNYNTAAGENSLFQNTDGSYNTGFGKSAGSNNTTGSENTAIGYNADFSTNNLTHATALGSWASVNASNKVRIGSTSVTVIEGQVAWTFPSDARFKFNIHDENVPGLAFIEQLRPVTYQFDTRKFDRHLMQNMPDSVQQQRLAGQDYSKSSATVQTGFLAQEVEAVCKKLGYEFSGLHVPASETDNYGLAYGSFVPLLVKAVQEQQAEIEKLNKSQIHASKLEIENAALKSQLEAERTVNQAQASQLDKITTALAGAGIAVEK
jgi:hypothetical protein